MTPPTDTTERKTEEREPSVLEAQVIAMRSQAIGIAESAKAFAVQCDSFLLTMRALSLGATAPPMRPTDGMPKRTFGMRSSKPADAADTAELEHRISQHPPSDGVQS